MVLDRYQNERKQLPQRVVVHKSSRYEPAERSGFEQALQRRVSQYDLVALRPTSEVRLILSREVSSASGHKLHNRRRPPRIRSWHILASARYPHGHVPSPLQIADHVGDTARGQLLRDVSVLTKMNWNSANMAALKPITLRFSELVGDILREVPDNEMLSAKFKMDM